MIDLGTVKPGSTLRIPYNTYDKDDGSSISQTTFAVADILVYKDGGTTERASTAGYTATTDFDAKTGKQLAIIDLSDNTTAGFFSSGSEYLVAIDAVTVDTVTTGGWIARFRIGYPGAILDTTIATLSSQTSFTLSSGPAEDDALNGMWAVIHDVASAVQMSWVIISDYTGSTKTVTLVAGATFTAAATDNISVMYPVPLQPTTAGRTLDVSTGGEAGVDWANVGSQSTSVNLSATTVNLVNTLTTYTGNTVQTGDAFARLGAPAGASVSADILTIDNLVDDLESRIGTPTNLGGGATISANLVDIEGQTDDIGTAGAGLTAVPWNAAWDAEVQSEVEDALVVHRLDELLNADSDIDGAAPPTVGSVFHELLSKTAGSFTFDQTTDSLEALRDRGDAAWITATGFSTHSAADVWSSATRTLTAGTNIVLAKGTGITGFNDLSAAQVNAEVVDVVSTDTPIDGKSIEAALEYIAAACAGRVSGAGTATETFLGLDEATTRLTVTTDSSGNRTDVVYG